MRLANWKLFAVGSLLSLSSLACTLSLAEDIQPPPGSELSGQVQQLSEVEYPLGPLNLARGAEIYAESCAPCHGEAGLGDGPQAQALPFEVPPIGTLEFGAEPSLDNWFIQVTDGNLDKFMPPFAQAYSVQERWDVLGYLASLWQGNADWAAQFEGLALPAGFSDLETVAPLAGEDLLRLLDSSGTLTSVELDAEGQLQLVGYSKLVALGIATAEEAAAEEAPSEAEEGTDAEAEAAEGEASQEAEAPSGIAGLVVNGSGGPIPEGLEVVMLSASNFDSEEIVSATVDAEGQFVFEEYEAEADQRYFFTVDVQGLRFFSPFYSAEQFAAGESVEVEFFESERNLENVRADVVNLVFNFAVEGQVQVVQQVILSNVGDKASAPGPDGDPLIFYELPENASNVLFESGQPGDRYIFEGNGFGDIRAVIPGASTYQVLFAYDLPYESGLEIEVPLQFATNNFGIFVPQGAVSPEGQEFIFHGTQLVQTQNYDSYLYRGSQEAGESIAINLQGLHPLNTSTWQRLVNNTDFLIGLGVLLAAVGGGYWWYRSVEGRGRSAAPSMTKTQLLDAIVELDEDFDDGELSERAYARQRRQLKEQLRQLTAKKGRSSQGR